MIKIYEYLEKNSDIAKEKMLYELGASEKDIFYKESEETSGGIFKTKKIKIEAILKDDILTYARDLIIDIVQKMGLEIKVETKKREEYLKFNLFSNNNAILIGKNGKTLDSLQIIVRSSIQNSTGFKTNIVIDVEDYREKQIQNIERNIKSIAFEVKRTGVPVSLDPMNSYERRTVHSICGEISGIITESLGEEPERYITIKRKD